MFSKSTQILSSTIDDEVVMMSSEKGMYYNLNPIGSRIWELLETPQTIESLCAQLMDEYDVDEATCKQETEEFIQSLAERGLIEIS
jgi:Coenzyme PQQ synthesis protein D (PqqD)